MLETLTTKVCFISFHNEVVAIFPEEVSGKYYACYAHIGQHSLCDRSLYTDYPHLKLTNLEAYRLYKELTFIGYNLSLV